MPRIAREQPTSRLKTFAVGCGVGCGTVLVALLVVFGILYSRLMAVPHDADGASRPARPDQPPSSSGAPPQSTPSIEEQSQQIRQAVESQHSVPVALRVNESQLNSLIAQEGGSSGDVRDLRVRLRDADMLVTGVATWAGRQVYLTAQVRPQASNGRLRLRLDSVRAGNLPLPGAAVSRLQAEVDRGMAGSLVVDERVYIDDAAVSNGELAISGHTTPR